MKVFLQKYSILITILFVVGGNFAFFVYYGEEFKDLAIVWPILLGVEIILIYIYMQSNIISPIKNLRLEIAKFLTGSKSEGSLTTKSSDPSVRYIINFFNKSFEILKNFKEELMSGKELKSEVQLAAEIQKATLDKVLPPIPSIDIVANTKSATDVGGDSYDVINQENNYYIYLGDVTGHGVASGFVMMMVNALISGFSKKLISSAEILANTNEILKPRVPSNMLMTLLMVRWNEKDKNLFMTGAGHEYLLVYKVAENKVYKIKSGGVALGMTRNISKMVKEVQIKVEEGDIIVMYTDGITEARNSDKENGIMYGEEKLMEAIKKSNYKTARGVYNSITIDLSKWMGYKHKQFDDITLLVMHYKGNKQIESDDIKVLPPENITEWMWN